jgi:hypothetical protein
MSMNINVIVSVGVTMIMREKTSQLSNTEENTPTNMSKATIFKDTSRMKATQWWCGATPRQGWIVLNPLDGDG